MNEEQWFITSYVINPCKQAFIGLLFVHKHMYIRIHIVDQYKADPTIQVQYVIQFKSLFHTHKHMVYRWSYTIHIKYNTKTI